MTDTRDLRTDHARHDLHLIAAAADRDADEATRAAAEDQIAGCRACAALFTDLRAISAGLQALPRSLPVTRDFRISPEQAARLRPAGWRRFLDGLVRPPSLRPIASALTTLGVAGLLLTLTLPNAGIALFGGQAGGGLTPQAADQRTSAGAPEAAASQGAQAPGADSGKGGDFLAGTPVPVAQQPGATDGRNAVGGGTGATLGATPGATAQDTHVTPPPTSEPASSTLPLLPLASVVLLVIGLALFVVPRFRGGDPGP